MRTSSGLSTQRKSRDKVINDSQIKIRRPESPPSDYKNINSSDNNNNDEYQSIIWTHNRIKDRIQHENAQEIYKISDYASNNSNNEERSKDNIHTLEVDMNTMNDDPRISRGEKIAKLRGGGRNTESFDPKSTLVRPDMRITIGPNKERLGSDIKIKHDDVIVVPNFFCAEDDWSIYYDLIKEMRECQAQGKEKSQWISWHEGYVNTVYFGHYMKIQYTNIIFRQARI